MHPRPECPRCSAPRSCGRSASERPAAFGRWRGSGGPRTGCYGGWLTAALTDEPPYVCQRAEVAELLRVDHRSDRLDDTLCDVEGEDADKAALVVHDDGTGLAVHLPAPDLDPGRNELPSRADQQAGDTIRADDRLQPGRPLASAVPVDDHVVGEQLDQSVHVAVGDRGEEAFGELVALPPGRFEPRSLRFDMATGAHGELPAVRLGLSEDLGDFVVAVAEHVVEQEDRRLLGVR